MFQIPKEGEMSRLVIQTGGHKEVKGILDPPEKFSIAIHTETLKKYYSVPQCADIKVTVSSITWPYIITKYKER